MYILSIDVGIKNFAVCLCEINNDSYSIIEWDVLDFSDQQNFKCCDNTCKNSAKYFKNENYYCLKHAKKTSYMIPDKNMKPNVIKKKKLAQLIDYMKSLQLELPEKYKKEDLLSIINNHINDTCLSTIEKTSCTYMDLITIGRNMMKQFDERLSNYNIDKVIIENQIGPLAIRMKTLQGMATQYFIMRSNCDIHFISSQNKLKEFENVKSKTYAERKKHSIEICKNLLENHPKIEYFNAHKKKDDLADSYLQCLWYIKQYINKDCSILIQ